MISHGDSSYAPYRRDCLSDRIHVGPHDDGSNCKVVADHFHVSQGGRACAVHRAFAKWYGRSRLHDIANDVPG